MKNNLVLSIIAVAVVFILFSPMSVLALELISFEDVDGVTFHPLDFVDLGIVLSNDGNESASFVVEQYVTYPTIPPMPLYEDVSIEAGGDVMISDLSFEIYQSTESGTYGHVVRVYDAVTNEIITERIVEFYVSETLGRIRDYNIMMCADVSCDDMRNTFIVGETAYIIASSADASEITVSVSGVDVPFSDGFAEFTPTSAGKYSAEIILGGDGLMDETITKDISFVDELNEPVYYFCHEVEDNSCEIACPGGEDPDCVKIDAANFNYMIILVILVIVAAVIGAFLFFRKRTTNL